MRDGASYGEPFAEPVVKSERQPQRLADADPHNVAEHVANGVAHTIAVSQPDVVAERLAFGVANVLAE